MMLFLPVAKFATKLYPGQGVKALESYEKSMKHKDRLPEKTIQTQLSQNF